MVFMVFGKSLHEPFCTNESYSMAMPPSTSGSEETCKPSSKSGDLESKGYSYRICYSCSLRPMVTAFAVIRKFTASGVLIVGTSVIA